MSKRNDITDGIFATTKNTGLIYTKKLGWIDLGHAQGNDARILKRKLEQERGSKYYKQFNGRYFPVTYHQEMTKRTNLVGIDLDFQTGVFTEVMVRSSLSPALLARVALTMMYGTAKRFEAWQNAFFFNWFTDSGFSAEDLVSDLVGFYRVFGTGPDPLWLANPVDYQTALQIWDAGDPVGRYKNTQFSPLLFHTTPPFNYAHPRRIPLPEWLSYIKPLNKDFTGILHNTFRHKPYDNFFGNNSTLKHELYGSVSLTARDYFPGSPSERPLFFLLNPHSPVVTFKK
ncbi:hypothetical protein [Enterobacter sp. ENT03]|uniref:hypothetical protein n=1 Tax=Enterobacter sp. ENT03 TaxID=2854780 RepID=UPI001C44433B|nr:hypothetical protein [Enterobacter sp. ENT03]MBV7407039.1 hypothetical protein [Enterobacter sp. ENT03]